METQPVRHLWLYDTRGSADELLEVMWDGQWNSKSHAVDFTYEPDDVTCLHCLGFAIAEGEKCAARLAAIS